MFGDLSNGVVPGTSKFHIVCVAGIFFCGDMDVYENTWARFGEHSQNKNTVVNHFIV